MTIIATLMLKDARQHWHHDLLSYLLGKISEKGIGSVISRNEGRVLDLRLALSDLSAARMAFSEISLQEVHDIIIQPENNRRKRVLVADMESTIIEQEMLDEIAGELGIREKVADITRRAMNGELDFEDALRARVDLLRGQPIELLHRVAERITITPGAAELVSAIKKSGGICWLVTGGFDIFADKIGAELGFDVVRANSLIIADGKLTGDVGSPVLDRDSKLHALNEVCAANNLSLADAIAVGDGANDLPMIEACNAAGGLGVAFHAKPRVRDATPHRIDYCGLDVIAAAQG